MTAPVIVLTGHAEPGPALPLKRDGYDFIHVAGLRLDSAAGVLKVLDGIDRHRVVLWVDVDPRSAPEASPELDTEAATDIAACCRMKGLSLALVVSGAGHARDSTQDAAILDRLSREYLVPCFIVDPEMGSAASLIERAANAAKPPQQVIDAKVRLAIHLPSDGVRTKTERVAVQAIDPAASLDFSFAAPTHVLAILFRNVGDLVVHAAPDEHGAVEPITVSSRAGLSLCSLNLDCYAGLRIRLTAASGDAIKIAGLITRPFTKARPTSRGAAPDPFPSELKGDPIDDLVKMEPGDLTYRPLKAWDKATAAEIVARARLLPARQLERLYPSSGPRSRWFKAAIGETFVDRVRHGRPLEWICPLTGEAAELKGSVPLRTGTMMFARLRVGLVAVIVDGAQPVACHYYAANLCLFYKVGPDFWKKAIVATCVSAAMPTRSRRTYLAAAFGDELPTAIVAGDRRPSHYLSQNVNALGRFSQEDVDRLAAKGGRLILIKDWCFLDPRDLLPALRALPATEIHSSELTTLARRETLRCIRPVRLGSRTDFSTLLRSVSRGGSSSRAPDDVLGLWICLDAERKRVLNQVELFVATLEAVRSLADAQGRRIVVYWDGWTLAGGQMTERDERVIASIRSIASDIVAGCSFHFDQVELFTHTLLEKVKIGGGARLAYATYGTAGLTPNVVGGIHLISYHVSQVVDDGGFADESNVTILPASAVTPMGKLDEGAHLHEFIVDPAALIDASLRYLNAAAHDGHEAPAFMTASTGG